ncbi:hypothetical protein LCGC14_2386520 [marine sediment metagenome]|uniref:PD-(D/E)XK endonuclease-like domain-containing protein n=1 Tax=marine sediment metagenome TaxID=412755 RepID=A0A0F9BZK0_9ZZZZ
MLIGFMCPKSGRGELFDFCFKKCLNKCMPLPVLISLSRQNREDEENIYHVTSILNPPQVEYLKRNNDYYVAPNSLVDMSIGSSWHARLEETKESIKELELEDDYLMEQNFRKTIMVQVSDGKVGGTCDPVLSGTSDLYVKSTKTLWDYKVMKYFYTFKYISEGKWEGNSIPMQLNIYRVYQYPEAEAIKIFVYLKDYKLNMQDKHDLSQTETLQVPMIPDEKVKKKVVDLLTEHVQAQETGKPRPCKEDELWINRSGVPLRCQNYCAVKEVCEQFAKWKEKE